MTAKKSAPKVEAPKAEAPKAEAPVKVANPQAELSALAEQMLCGKSGMIAIRAEFTALTIVDDQIVEVPMGSLQTAPRENKTGSRGFHLSAKLNDPTLIGQAHGTRYQVGANITAVGSKDW